MKNKIILFICMMHFCIYCRFLFNNVPKAENKEQIFILKCQIGRSLLKHNRTQIDQRSSSTRTRSAQGYKSTTVYHVLPEETLPVELKKNSPISSPSKRCSRPPPTRPSTKPPPPPPSIKPTPSQKAPSSTLTWNGKCADFPISYQTQLRTKVMQKISNGIIGFKYIIFLQC